MTQHDASSEQAKIEPRQDDGTVAASLTATDPFQVAWNLIYPELKRYVEQPNVFSVENRSASSRGTSASRAPAYVPHYSRRQPRA